ncbi:MAG TPA: gamma-glutamyl-gamma-aminobutyrate hydrolase family protein [Fimbriimonas sp.]|nr:gamma-glutamyl-gamma-aminobutyrate hydrolase family protein [Fimbriimonas sp.]
MKPLIAITTECDFDANNPRSKGKISLNYNYAEQVALAGGNPVLVSPVTDLTELLPLIDGWLIPGGADMDATHFGEENHPEVELMNPKRWEMERAMYDLVDPLMPIFGICYGCQFINVMRGGSLIQHLPDVVSHDQHSGGTLQRNVVCPNSKLYKHSGALSIEGASYHHQAVNRLGEGLDVVSRHEDGTIEAVEDPVHPFFIGVQWHPERTPEDVATQNLFRAFVEAARSYQGVKS